MDHPLGLLRGRWLLSLDYLGLVHNLLHLELGDLNRLKRWLGILFNNALQLVNDLLGVVGAILLLLQLIDQAGAVRCVGYYLLTLRSLNRRVLRTDLGVELDLVAQLLDAGDLLQVGLPRLRGVVQGGQHLRAVEVVVCLQVACFF